MIWPRIWPTKTSSAAQKKSCSALIESTGDEKLTSFAARLALAGHRGIPRENELDFLSRSRGRIPHTPSPKPEIPEGSEEGHSSEAAHAHQARLRPQRRRQGQGTNPPRTPSPPNPVRGLIKAPGLRFAERSLPPMNNAAAISRCLSRPGSPPPPSGPRTLPIIRRGR